MQPISCPSDAEEEYAKEHISMLFVLILTQSKDSDPDLLYVSNT